MCWHPDPSCSLGRLDPTPRFLSPSTSKFQPPSCVAHPSTGRYRGQNPRFTFTYPPESLNAPEDVNSLSQGCLALAAFPTATIFPATRVEDSIMRRLFSNHCKATTSVSLC